MKTKIIGISFAIIVIGLMVFILRSRNTQETKVMVPKKITKSLPEPIVKVISVDKNKPAEWPKPVGIGKMPDLSDKEGLEAFFNKAFLSWNEQVAKLILRDLGLGQEALEKYLKIRNDYYESQFALFQVKTSHEPAGDGQGQRRLTSTINNVKKTLEEDHGINLDTDELNNEDYKKIQNAVQKAMNDDSQNFLSEHLNQIKEVLGEDGFSKYQKLKDDFNREITDDNYDPLFKI